MRAPLAGWLAVATAILSAATPVPARMATDVCGPVAAGATWTRAASPYQTTCDVSVPAGAMLTIEPGVEVRLGANHAINVDGALRAVGTAEAPIRFGPSGEQSWFSVQLTASSGPSEIGHAVFAKGGGARKREMLGIATDRALVHHVEFADADGFAVEVAGGASPTIRDSRFIRASSGAANPPAALRLRGASRAVVENNYFESNDQFGAFWDADASPRFSGNRFEFNAVNGVLYYGTVTGDVTLPSLGPRRWAYNVTRTGIAVDRGGMLNIAAGATMKFAPGLGIRVQSGGTLAVRGAAGAKVRFSTNGVPPKPGQWREIDFQPGSIGWDAEAGTGSIIDHAELEYGGSSQTGVLSIRNSSPRVSHTTIRDSGRRGVTVNGPDARPRFVGNLFADNVADPDGIGLFVSGQAAPEVTFSIFRNNFEGIHVETGARPRIGPHDWFDYNGTFAVVNTDGATCVNAAGNDWGSALGPRDPSAGRDACDQAAHGGDGELVSDNVRFAPFEGRLVRPQLTGPRCGTYGDSQVEITGLAAPASTVRLYDNEALLGETTAPDGDGELEPFAFVPSPPLAAGSHVIQIRSVKGELESGIADPLEFTVDPTWLIDPARMSISYSLEGTHFVQPFQDEAGCLTLRGDGEWSIRAHPGAPLTLSVPVHCPNASAPAAEIEYRGQTMALTPSGPGDDTHTATFEMADGGALRLRVACGESRLDRLIGTVQVEQNGFVYDKAGQPDPFANRVKDAKVTLFVRDRSLPAGQDWVRWPGEAYFGQSNPQTTGITGWYAFYPPPGQYRIVAEAPGYERVILTGEKVTTEPIVQNIGLQPMGSLTPTPAATPTPGGRPRLYLPALADQAAVGAP